MVYGSWAMMMCEEEEELELEMDVVDDGELGVDVMAGGDCGVGAVMVNEEGKIEIDFNLIFILFHNL